MLIWITIAAGCEYLMEIREPPTEVSWAGNVLAGPGYEDLMSTGTFAFYDLDGELLAEGEQPSADNPGYWRATLPVDTEFELRIDGGEGYYPGVWRGVSPEGAGLWYTGTWFGWPTDFVDAYLAELSGGGGLTVGGGADAPGALADSEVAHLWGYFWNYDDVDPALIEVVDSEDVSHEVTAWEISEEDGSLSVAAAAPAHYFVAFDLPPGPVTVRYGGEDLGTWTAEGGDLVTPWWFVVP